MAYSFDPENPNHTLVSCGDAIDRGPRPNEVIKYFVNLPRKVLIRGNHEDLMAELLDSPYGPQPNDYSNGTWGSVVELASKHHKVNYGTKIGKTLASYMDWDEVRKFARAEKTYRQYESLLVNYFETEHYIFVHGWIPNYSKKDINGGKWVTKYKYMEGWSGKFSIMDFYLQNCSKARLGGYTTDNLQIIDIGKPETLEKAEAFINA